MRSFMQGLRQVENLTKTAAVKEFGQNFAWQSQKRGANRGTAGQIMDSPQQRCLDPRRSQAPGVRQEHMLGAFIVPTHLSGKLDAVAHVARKVVVWVLELPEWLTGKYPYAGGPWWGRNNTFG
jgi:hypothetical protein